MPFETIDVTLDESVQVITLNRPEKLNPLSTKTFAELSEAFEGARHSDDVRAVLLTAEGRAFSAGGDIAELASGALGADTFMKARLSSKEFVMGLKSFEKPFIAAVNGLAAGGGAGLVLASDVVFASDLASFSIIFRRIGMIPDCGCLYLLAELVGPSKAKELAFSGDIIDAQEMQRLGIAQHIVSPDELFGKAMEFAKKCAAGPQRALGLSKILIDRSSALSIEEYFDYESLALPLVMESADFKEGVSAFIEKRQPMFGQTKL